MSLIREFTKTKNDKTYDMCFAKLHANENEIKKLIKHL